MKTDEVLKGVRIKKGVRFFGIEVSNISADAEKLEKGSCFVAIKRKRFDGQNFINEAVQKGASLIVTESVLDIKMMVPWIQVEDAKASLSIMAANLKTLQRGH